MSKFTSSNPFDAIPDGSLGIADLEGYARQKGYSIQGGKAVKYMQGMGGHGIPVTTDLSDFADSVQPKFLDQAGALMKDEWGAKQGAADRQFGRNNTEINATRDFLSGMPGQFDAASNQAGGQIDDLMGSLSRFGEGQSSKVTGAINDLLSGVVSRAGNSSANIDNITKDGMIQMRQSADRAEATAADAITKYDTGVQENVIQATVNGMRQQMRTRMGQIANGINPDGTRMTPAERAEAQRNLTFDMGQQTATMAAQVRQSAQHEMAGLRTNLAALQMEGGKMRGAAADLGLRGEDMKAQQGDRITAARNSGINAILASQEGQRAIQGMISNLTQYKTQLRNGNKMASLNMEMQGRTGIAEMVRDNPETVISILSSFLSLGAIASAPGGRNLPGIRF